MNAGQQNALDELSQKSLVDIQVETARAWAYRAWAANVQGKVADCIEYAHEALEHAALSGDDALLAEVRSIIRGEQ